MKKIIKLMITVVIVCICASSMLTVSAANPDMSAFERRTMYDRDVDLENVPTVGDANGWVFWMPPAVGDKTAATFTVEAGEKLHGFSLDCIPVGTQYDLKIWAFPAAADMLWEDDPAELTAAYAEVTAGTPIFEVIGDTIEEANPDYTKQSQDAFNMWGINPYGIKSYVFDEPFSAGTYVWEYTFYIVNHGPVGTFALSDYTGISLNVNNGDIVRMPQPYAMRASFYVTAPFKEYNKAVAAANALNPDAYVDFSAVTQALSVDVSGLTDQAAIDAQTKAILDAIAALELKPATATPEAEGTPAPTEAPDADKDKPADNKDDDKADKGGAPVWLVPVIIAAVVVIVVVVVLVIKKKK